MACAIKKQKVTTIMKLNGIQFLKHPHRFCARVAVNTRKTFCVFILFAAAISAKSQTTVQIIDELDSNQTAERVVLRIGNQTRYIRLNANQPRGAANFVVPAPGNYPYSIVVRTRMNGYYEDLQTGGSEGLQSGGAEQDSVVDPGIAAL